MAQHLPARPVSVAGDWPEPDPAARARLGRVLAAVPAGSVVLLDGLVACGVPDVLAPHARRLRLVVLVHLPLADETGLAPRQAAVLDKRERETLRLADRIVVTSPAAADDLRARHDLAAGSVYVVPPGVDSARPAAGTDGVSRLLCVAAVIPRKGQDVLLSALSEVDGLTVDLVGSLTRAPAYVERLRGTAGPGNRIRFTGPRTGPGLDAAYERADLLVLPSRAETYGMVVTEALARGIPVLASDVGGVAGALGHAPGGEVPGLLVPPGDVAELAGALRRWTKQPGLRNRLRTAARTRAGTLEGWPAAAARLGRALP
ncbi:glycosyltransferase family 4 protein [Amycolatopsis ultiminotia]